MVPARARGPSIVRPRGPSRDGRLARPKSPGIDRGLGARWRPSCMPPQEDQGRAYEPPGGLPGDSSPVVRRRRRQWAPKAGEPRRVRVEGPMVASVQIGARVRKHESRPDHFRVGGIPLDASAWRTGADDSQTETKSIPAARAGPGRSIRRPGPGRIGPMARRVAGRSNHLPRPGRESLGNGPFAHDPWLPGSPPPGNPQSFTLSPSWTFPTPSLTILSPTLIPASTTNSSSTSARTVISRLRATLLSSTK
jgi:hypothetical protein